MGRGTSDTEATTTVRPRNLSDAAMDLAVRQVIDSVAGQANHAADFFGRYVADPGWDNILQGTLEVLYQRIDAYDELQSQSGTLVIEGNSFDPRWDAAYKLDGLSVTLWKSGRYADAVKVDEVASRFQDEFTPLKLEGREEQTDRLHAEIVAGEGKLAQTVNDAVFDLRKAAEERGVTVPAAVLADYMESILDTTGRDGDYENADLKSVARRLLAGE